jgi:ubiquinone/menaquinone biosynthesis C-methylase UbiE
MKLRLRRERILVGLRGLALLRGWPFGHPEEADTQLDAVRDAVAVDASAMTIDADGVGVAEAYASWSLTYDAPNPLIVAEEPAVRAFLEGIDRGLALDVATGTGRLARLLGELGHRVIALDVSEEMLDRARVNAPGAALVRGDVRALPVRDASVDLVTCALALTHVADLRAPIAGFAGVLRPGGRLIVSDIHPVAVATGAHAFFVRADGTRGVVRNEIHWPSEYVEAFRSAGLVIERAAEPAFNESFVDEMPEQAVRDAAREALIGLPFALVWLVEKP